VRVTRGNTEGEGVHRGAEGRDAATECFGSGAKRGVPGQVCEKDSAVHAIILQLRRRYRKARGVTSSPRTGSRADRGVTVPDLELLVIAYDPKKWIHQTLDDA